MHARYAMGIDLGTSGCRVLIADAADGSEIGLGSAVFATGDSGVVVDPREPNLARQHPADYPRAIEAATRSAIAAARAHAGFAPDRIVGIGVDATGSTPLPVDASNTPLAMNAGFERDPAAMAWLWKDHTSHAEAAEITRAARERGLPYLHTCGGTYSSEWFWSKLLRCLRTAPHVARAAAAWVELSDWIPAWLAGCQSAADVNRNVCAAGHKAMHHPSWQGLPSTEFLGTLHPDLARFRYHQVYSCDQSAGTLHPAIAQRLGLPAGIPIAIGAIDAHLGAVGAGIKPGTLVKIIGTSTCDCMVAPILPGQPLPDIPGVCGVVPGSILPGMVGIEAGQSAVGDIFQWFASRFATSGGVVAHAAPNSQASTEHTLAALTAEAAALAPGQSGLLALDWHNGNRNVLADPRLSGLLVGMSLATTPAEIYRALVEATAFGALRIMEQIQSHGIAINEVINCGGIAEKNPLVMQIYADVCNRAMKISRSSQTCALGAAICGSVVGGTHPTIAAAQQAMTGVRTSIYTPNPAAAATCASLYRLYRTLHDAFGQSNPSSPHSPSLAHVMKELIALRDAARTTR